MRNFLMFLAVAAILPAGGYAGERVPESGPADSGKVAEFPQKFDPRRDAAQDIRNAIAAAKGSHRRILLDVGGEWCIWCRRLDTLFASHPDIDEFLHRNFVVVKLNWSPENRNVEVLSKYPKIPGYPHFFVLDSDGKLLRSQDTGALESGNHHDPGKVLAFLKRWAPQARPKASPD